MAGGLVVGGQFGWLAVKGVDLFGDGGVFVGDDPVGDARIDQRHLHLAMVDALNRLPTGRDSFAFKCTGEGVPTAAYALIIKYSLGPPAAVNIYQGCTPAIHNGNLQATDAATVLPVLLRILNH